MCADGLTSLTISKNGNLISPRISADVHWRFDIVDDIKKWKFDIAENISGCARRFDIVDDIKKWKFDIAENISGCARAV